MTERTSCRWGFDYGTTANNGNVLSQTIGRERLRGTLTQHYRYDGANRLELANGAANNEIWRERLSDKRGLAAGLSSLGRLRRFGVERVASPVTTGQAAPSSSSSRVRSATSVSKFFSRP